MPEKPAPAPRKPVPAMLADTDFLFRQAKEGSDAFLAARPFPHLLLPSLIKPACCVALFEGLQAEGLRARKVTTASARHFYPQLELPPVLRLLLWELSSSTLIRHFASLTGKPPLLPDPFLLHSGVRLWQQYMGKDAVQSHVAEQEFFARHPETQLQNCLRVELFACCDPNGTFTMELFSPQGTITATQIGSNGSVLFMNSDHYHLQYRCQHPSDWCSLVLYYYINDRARNLNGQEQPHGGY